MDDEIARATAAEKVLNEKHVLTWDDTTTSYKYLNLKDINADTQALVDENALDAKLGELSLGFFVFYQIDPATDTLVEASKFEGGVNPYYILDVGATIPSDAPNGSYALMLNNNTSVYLWQVVDGQLQSKGFKPIQNGWLFAEESTGHGFYWFQNTWNKIDMNVDMSQYYKKSEIDNILTGYVQNTTLGSLSDLTTSNKTTIVAAIF